MQNIWVNKNDCNRKRVIDEEKPVLDEHRSRIITFDKFFHQKPVQKTPFSYLRERGYELIGQIGRGGYGAVYKARSLQDLSKFYAIKVNYDIVSRSTLYLEVAFFHLIRKRSNLPKIVDFFIVQNSPHMVLQFFEHQQYIDVFDSIKTLQQLKHYMIELLKGLNTLKSMGIFHRDIKPQNFLYNMKTRRGIIADFGLAQIDSGFITMYIEKRFVSYKKKIPELQRKNNKRFIQLKQEYNLYKKIESANLENGVGKLGTQSYCCIQTILHYEQQGHQCEMWSVGVIFIQFLVQKMHFFNQIKINKTNQPKYATIFIMQLATLFGADVVKDYIQKMGWTLLFPKQIEQKIDIKQIIRLKSSDQSQNQKAFDLLKRLLTINRNQRITVQEAIWHPFFDEIRQQHFESHTQKKWFKRQMKKRSGQPLSEKQQYDNQQIQGKSGQLNQMSSQFQKSATKVKRDSQMNEQNSSEQIKSQRIQKKKKRKEKSREDSDQSQQKKNKKIKKKKKPRKVYFESEQQCKQDPKNQDKGYQQTQKLFQRQNLKVQDKQPDIYETIRRYLPLQKQQQNKSNRIDLNIDDRQERPKKSKVKRNMKSGTPIIIKQTKIQINERIDIGEKIQTEKLRKEPKNKIIQPFIDQSLRKIIKQEQQRLQKEQFSPNSHSNKSLIVNRQKPQAIVYQPSSSSSYSPFIEDDHQQNEKQKHQLKIDQSLFKKNNMDQQSDHYFDGED